MARFADNGDVQAAETPVSPKVTASTTSAAGTIVLLFLLGQIEFIADWPEEVRGALFLLIVAAFTFLAGWVRRDPLRRASL